MRGVEIIQYENTIAILFRSHILQADSAEILNAWISALHGRIGAAIQDYKERDNSMNAVNDTLPGAKRIQKMYVLQSRPVW